MTNEKLPFTWPKLNSLLSRLENEEELELLTDGDVVEIKDRKYPMRVHYNDSAKKMLNLFGRGGGESIQWIIAQYPDIKVEEGKLSLTNPEVDTFWKQGGDNRHLYDFSKRLLIEKGIWETE